MHRQKDIHLDTSFHDRRKFSTCRFRHSGVLTFVLVGKVRALLQVFHKSGDAQAATYKAIEDTGYGYIGYASSISLSKHHAHALIISTINCASANVGIDPSAKT